MVKKLVSNNNDGIWNIFHYQQQQQKRLDDNMWKFVAKEEEVGLVFLLIWTDIVAGHLNFFGFVKSINQIENYSRT
ncbi:unnamed protein product [Meloidogyne enterolobii]|uniref:Uncharacterized protein n=1 Tax=Meloidogyne enterolobii TaxID=390850 RepID=A0ACB1A1E1_MELEN